MRPWQGFYFTRLLSLKFCVFMGHLNQETEYRWSPFDQKDLLTKHSSSWERAYTARIERNPIKNPTSKQLNRTRPNLGYSIDSWSPIFWGQSPERKEALRRAISQKKIKDLILRPAQNPVLAADFFFTPNLWLARCENNDRFGTWLFRFAVQLNPSKRMLDKCLQNIASRLISITLFQKHIFGLRKLVGRAPTQTLFCDW